MEKPEPDEIPELQHDSSTWLPERRKSLHRLFANRQQKSRRECKASRGLKNRFPVQEYRTRYLHIYTVKWSKDRAQVFIDLGGKT